MGPVILHDQELTQWRNEYFDRVIGPKDGRHLEAIDHYVRAGYDHIILTQIGPNQDRFLEFFERELASRLRKPS